MSLFTGYEQRPPFCQAAPVWFDTVDNIASYFTGRGYETTVTRKADRVELRIVYEGSEQRPTCDLSVTLLHDPPTGERLKRWMLLYGHPPTLEDYDEFHARWQEHPDIQAAIDKAVSMMPAELREKWEAGR